MFKLVAMFGLVSIILGTFMISLSGRVRKNTIYTLLLFGGSCLLIYSIYIGDLIFIVLQAAYILIVIYDVIKLRAKRKKK